MPIRHSYAKVETRPPESGAKIRKIGDGTSAVSTFRAALNNPELSDLTLNVRGTVYYVHRTLLALRSPMFRAMLTGGFKEAVDGVVTIDTFPAEHFYAVLEWAYTGTATMTASTVLGVLRAADYCQFDDLVLECRQLAIRFVDSENVLPLLRSSIHFDEESVTQACLAFWAKYPLEVMKCAHWMKANAESLCRLLAHPTIAASEDVILASTIAWLRSRRLLDEGEAVIARSVSARTSDADEAEAVTSDEDLGRPDGDNPESARNLVMRVMRNIRIGQLSTSCILDAVKPIVARYDVLRLEYMGALEYKLDPDRVTFSSDNIYLQPRS